MNKKGIAIIIARGGSKRIPKKNIKDFCGKPIIAYSIEVALQANIFDEVMVSTDSEEIAAIAKKYGAKCPFMRSKKNSDDFAVTSDVIMEVMNNYAKLEEKFDYICCIYPTAPFITAERLRQAFDLLEKNDAEEIMPVVAFSYPPQRCFIIQNNYIQLKYPKYKYSRSQDLETYYHDAGQFYMYRTEQYMKKCGKDISKIVPMIVPEMQVQDIDNEEDWKLAELKYQFIKKRECDIFDR